MTLMLLLITAVLLFSGALLFGFTALYRTSWGDAHHIREAKDHSLTPSRFWKNAGINAAVSLALVYGLSWLTMPFVFHEGEVGIGRSLVEGLAVLLSFDFFYYLVHRYPFHEWRGYLRKVHSIHHIVRNPIAIDSLYQHPVEDTLGLVLLWACAALVRVLMGPIAVVTFGWVFLVYSMLNVVVHCGLRFERGPMRLVGYLATRHNKHHVDMNGKNYASVTPLWDHVLGTEEP